jgi:hypothetical protein
MENSLRRFYGSLVRLENYTEKRRCFGTEPVSKCWWPTRGVYFFLDNNEKSIISDFPMAVYVGTHAIRTPYETHLEKRLSMHWGNQGDGGGNHRSSILRGHIGASFIEKNNLKLEYPEWGFEKNNGASELSLEIEVSKYIRKMGILVLDIEDWQGRKSIEANAIAFLSSATVKNENPISKGWLGNHCVYRNKKLNYQLWNRYHCGSIIEQIFFDKFDKFVDITIKKWGMRRVIH